jgi:hypothetical protein
VHIEGGGHEARHQGQQSRSETHDDGDGLRRAVENEDGKEEI